MLSRTQRRVWLALSLLAASASASQDPLLWPEAQRAFFQDGPGWLLDTAARTELGALDEAGRAQRIEAFLASDPLPETPENELRQAIERRLAVAYADFGTPADMRFQLQFLHGKPLERVVIDCGQTFRPLEVWHYSKDIEGSRRSLAALTSGRPQGTSEGGKRVPRWFKGWDEGPRLVLYRANPAAPFQLWTPYAGKNVLYVPEMEYLLQQYEELKNFISGKRFDRETCKQAELVDLATGVSGLKDFYRGRPSIDALEAFTSAPTDLATWVREALGTPAPQARPTLEAEPLVVSFPRKAGDLMQVRMLTRILPSSALKPTPDGDLAFLVEGTLESAGAVFAEARARYKVPPKAAVGGPVLALDEALRPGQSFVLRMRIQDETGGAETRLATAFVVPPEPIRDANADAYEDAVATGERIAKEVAAEAADSLILAPPIDGQVALATWRAQVLITGQRIARVVFYVDGKPQATRSEAPWTAELRLSPLPTEQIVAAEGLDADGAVVARDEVILNQPRGAFRVRILEPAAGARLSGTVPARAEVVVPDERKVERVEFRVNDQVVVTLAKPPWVAPIAIPPRGGTDYLTVVAFLDDGRQGEDLRFLNAPDNVSELEVRLVELYTTVTDRSGRLVRGLERGDFEVAEEGRPQEITKFELVENLALTVGITIDTSGSMADALADAQEAGREFVEQVMRPADRCFVVAFSGRPSLLMPPTQDVGACRNGLEGLQAVGWTALHDALVTSLYYMRDLEGQRALILLSDGDDTASSIAFEDALEFARRSGVVIFPIGLNLSAFDIGISRKLGKLAEETGGRVFSINRVTDLSSVYQEIESELRSRYLIAYASDRPDGKGYRTVEIKAKKGGLKARTIRGYYR